MSNSYASTAFSQMTLSNNSYFVKEIGSYGSDNGQFSGLRGIAVESKGNVYAADTNNNRIQKFDSNGSFIPKWSPSGIGIAISSKGNVYVTDSGKQITEFVPYPLSYNYTKDIKPMLPAQAPHAGISDQF